MSHNVQRFGSVTIARSPSSSDLKRLLKDPQLKADIIVVKPNWVGISEYGFYGKRKKLLLFSCFARCFNYLLA